MANLFDPPSKLTLPLVKGQDVNIEITYKVLLVDGDGEPVLDGDGKKQYVVTDFPDGAAVSILVEPAAAAQGTIDGSKARLRLDHALVDKTKDQTLWRVTMTEEDGLDTVLLHGTTRRYDGA